ATRQRRRSRMYRTAGLLVLSLAVGFAAPAGAADQLLPGKKLLLRTGRLNMTAKSPSVAVPAAPASDPTLVGASLEIRAASGEIATIALPASNWTKNGPGTIYKFKNPDAPAGPSAMKVAMKKQAKQVRLYAKSSGITLDESTQTRIGLILAMGPTRYCVLFGGT